MHVFFAGMYVIHIPFQADRRKGMGVDPGKGNNIREVSYWVGEGGVRSWPYMQDGQA